MLTRFSSSPVQLFCVFIVFLLNVATCRGYLMRKSSLAFTNYASFPSAGNLKREAAHKSDVKEFSSVLSNNKDAKFDVDLSRKSLFESKMSQNVAEQNDVQQTISQENSDFRIIDLRGKVAFIAGVGDSSGYGWAIAKQLASAGALITVGTWPPILSIFKKSLEMKKFDKDAKLTDGSLMKIDKIYPLDAAFDTPEDVTDEIKNNKRYSAIEGYTISEVVEKVRNDYGKIDILVHSLANGSEVTKPLSETSRKGYLNAISASSFSFVSLVSNFAQIMNPGASAIALSYIASERVIPGYGGGMSSAKAALESDTKTLAFELGRKFGLRVNAISAGPLKSRAASAIGKDGSKTFIEYAIDYSLANAPLQQSLLAEDIGNSALFLLSPLSRAITGVTLYVDNGLHAMGQATDSFSLKKSVD